MEQISGRLTADATVNTLKDDKQVVNFSVAVNERYKTKGGEKKETTRFFRCAYWVSGAIAPYLKKGGLVELSGRIDQQVWNDAEGKAKGTLVMNVNNIRFLEKGTAVKSPDQPVANAIKEPADLPF